MEQRVPTTSEVPGSIPLRDKFGKSCGGEGDSLRLRRFPPGTPVSSYLTKFAQYCLMSSYNALSWRLRS